MNGEGLSGKRGVRSAECGVENTECRKCGVWKMRSVENVECGKCGGITPNITPSRPMPPVRTLEKHSTLNEMKKIILFVCLFSKPRNLVLVKHVFRILEK